MTAGVEVRLGTEAVPEILAGEDYDAVIAGCGSLPKFPEVPGAEGKTVCAPMDVFGHEDDFHGNIVVIGGAATGMETAVHLARCGKTVTLLTRKARPGYDLVGHSGRIVDELVQKQQGLTSVCQVEIREITDSAVTYVARDGLSLIHI